MGFILYPVKYVIHHNPPKLLLLYLNNSLTRGLYTTVKLVLLLSTLVTMVMVMWLFITMVAVLSYLQSVVLV